MSSDESTQWQITDTTQAGMSSQDLVLAWARDQATGEPIYILSLGKDRRGAKCGCECYGCDLQLTAINAAKTKYKRRPHFRHPDGTHRESCAILSARAIALQTLNGIDYLTLPRRRKPSRIAGLSGQYYEAWVEAPPETVKVQQFDFVDRATGLLTLDDGRQVIVQLIGRADVVHTTDTEGPTPRILLIVDDPEVAMMAPEDIRKRITILMEGGIWCSHWADAQLDVEAKLAAISEAESAFDWMEGAEELDTVAAKHCRETLLHLKAKEILEREKRLMLPEIEVTAELHMPSGTLNRKVSSRPSTMVHLHEVMLEKPIGSIRPDVLARTNISDLWPAETILIEITVTNTINDERLERIRATGIPALEINISLMGGRVTEAEFTRLVVQEEAGKRWLHHPWMVSEKVRLKQQIADDAHQIREEKAAWENHVQRKEALRQKPATEWAALYLLRVESQAACELIQFDPDFDPEDLRYILNEIADCEEGLAAYNYPAPFHQDIYQPVMRILSLRHQKAIGFVAGTMRSVITAILDEGTSNPQWQSVFLIALKVYEPPIGELLRERVRVWREKVLTSLCQGEKTFRRNRGYDRLLSLFFPEMAPLLDQPLPGERGYVVKQPSYSSPRVTSNYWLTGSALEEWKRQYPDAAAWWFK